MFMVVGTGGIIVNVILILGVIQRRRDMLVLWEAYHAMVICLGIIVLTQFPKNSLGLLPLSTSMIITAVIATVLVLSCMLCVYNLICLIDERSSHVFPNGTAVSGGRQLRPQDQIQTISGAMRHDRSRRNRRHRLFFPYENSLPSYYDVIKTHPSPMTMEPPSYDEAIRLSRQGSPARGNQDMRVEECA